MRITEEAQSLLKESIKANNADALYVQIENSCHGESLSFALAMKEEDDTIMTIDNVPVIIDLVALKRAEEVTILVQNGQLLVDDQGASQDGCSGCSGCGSH